MKITIQTLTPLWTGGVDQTSDRLHETGLIGSLRWWYEALVRGLGGYACDPTSKDRCPDKPDKDEKHCAACELFGCTGWARKFRMEILDDHKNLIQNGMQERQTFILRFVPLRPIAEEEWCLLNLIVRWIAEYGALGGKTVFKPSDEAARQKRLPHKDFGLIQYVQSDHRCAKTLDELKTYITLPKWRSGSHIYRDGEEEHDYSWASLDNFWSVKWRYLARQNVNVSTFNQVIGRKQPKSQAQQLDPNNVVNRWLAGSQQESKKVFSFKHPAENGRTFGFAKPELVNFDEMKKRLGQAWTDFDPNKEFLTGEQILKTLCSTEGGDR